MGIRGRQVSLRAAAERPMTLDSLAFAFYYHEHEVVRWLSMSISIIICVSKYPRSTCGGGEVVEHGPQPVLLPAQLLLQPLHPGELLNLGR